VNIGESFNSTHTPTLIWGLSLSTILVILAVVLLVLWVLRRDKRGDI
jgi:hypothetical protein